MAYSIGRSIQLSDIEGQRAHHPLVLRWYIQLLGGFFFAVLVPIAVGLGGGFSAIGTSASQFNTIVATSCALIVGFILFRGVVRYPGVRASLLVVPTFSLVYIAMTVLILFARLDYSRLQFGLSFFLCLGWFILVWVLANRVSRSQIAVVPGGRTGTMEYSERIDWHVLSKPHLTHDKLTCVVADLSADLSDDWERFIADCAVRGVPVLHVKQLQESLSGRVQIDHLSENVMGSVLPNTGLLEFKRTLDFFAAILMLPLFLPVIGLVALTIKIAEGGKVFFVQERIGHKGKPFKLIKFRTMREFDSSADPRASAMTRTDDVRITPLGKFLRRSRLDEIPQIFNILAGTMSWIGPRPEARALSEWYEKDIPFYRYRFVVRPGITGWAQVSQGHVAELEEVKTKLQFDFYYIKNLSPWLDILIVLKTLRIMCSGFGAR